MQITQKFIRNNEARLYNMIFKRNSIIYGTSWKLIHKISIAFLIFVKFLLRNYIADDVEFTVCEICYEGLESQNLVNLPGIHSEANSFEYSFQNVIEERKHSFHYACSYISTPLGELKYSKDKAVFLKLRTITPHMQNTRHASYRTI